MERTARILLIEDEPPVRAILSRCLALEGYDVITAQNGEAGLQLAHEREPDLIICDLVMPEVDGYGVLAGVRANPALASTPFIFLSASADRAERETGLKRGATEYLTKPFSLEEVLVTIRRNLQARRLGY
jgi:DNA-binding response OmpR family regulator